jgi:cell division protein FtsW
MNAGKYIKGDRVIWMVIVLLSVISLLAVYSSSQSLASSSSGNSTIYYLIKQFIILLVGLFIIITTHLVPYRFFSRLSQIFLYIAIPLLLVTLLSGRDINSARRWLDVPGTGFTIQPSDFAKIALIMYVARILSQKQDLLSNYKEAYMPVILATAAICFLIVPANFSTAAILLTTSAILMFIGRIPVRFLLLTLAGAILLFVIFLQVMKVLDVEGRRGTWGSRIENFMNRDDENVDNFQVNRAKVAIVNGGLFGRGPGNSIQKEKLPQANSDFIYAIIIEEYGLIGGIVVLVLYLWLLFRTSLIVRRSSRTFAALVSIGLCMIIVFQAMVNMAVAVNLVPVTGQPLPYISNGGSSVLFTSIALGVILSVSWGVEEDNRKRMEEENLEKENGNDE